MEKKVIGYVRVTDSALNPSSGPMQRNAIEEFCLKHNINDVEIFEDCDTKTSAYDRPGFRKMLDALKQREEKGRIVVIGQLDRLSRNMREMMRFLDDAYKSGIEGVYSADYPETELTDYMHLMEIGNLETMAPRLLMLEPLDEACSVIVTSDRRMYYIENKEASIYLNWEFQADLCELSEDGTSIILGNSDKTVIPVGEIWGFVKSVDNIGIFGYTEVDGELKVNEAAAKIIKKIFQMEDAGKLK